MLKKVNVFGVGRSGTTGIQLYLSYLFSEQYDKVRVNSEPYIWQTRKGPLSFYGQEIFLKSPIVAEPDINLSEKHNEYLKSLSDESKTPVVNKFIRGNGIIEQINLVTKPDISILVYRDIYQVLSSLKKYTWEYTDIYNNYLSKEKASFWLLFLSKPYVQKVLKDYNLTPDSISCNAEIRNAFFWFVNNLKALSCRLDNIYHVPFNEISVLEKLVAANGFTQNYPMKSKLFFGDNLNKDCTIVDVNTQKKNYKRVLTELDSFCFFLNQRFNFHLPMLLRECGSIVRKTPGSEVTEVVHRPTSKTIYKSEDFDSLINEFREIILAKLKAKMEF